ncbi:MAG TPA: AI-2E family transporter [Candidatus Limnocylindrales bacterium]
MSPTTRSATLRWSARGAGFSVGVALVAVICWIAIAAAPVLLLIFVATLLASALEPIIVSIRGVVPLGRGATILIVYATFLAIVIALALIVVPAAYNQLGDIGGRLPNFFQRAREWSQGIGPDAVRSSLLALIDAGDQAIRPAPPDPETVVAAGLTVAGVVLSVVTVLTIVFFWLVEHARLQRYALAFLPAGRRPGAREAWNEVEARLGLWVRGQLILMATVGFATGTAYWLLGVPAALSLGVFAALAEAIPLIGPLVGAIPALIVAATVSVPLALAVAAVYIVIQFVEGNVLVPIVMRNTIGLSPYLVIVSLLVGGQAGGIAGAFIAVPLAASLEVVLERMQAREEAIAPSPRLPSEEVAEAAHVELSDVRPQQSGALQPEHPEA